MYKHSRMSRGVGGIQSPKLGLGAYPRAPPGPKLGLGGLPEKSQTETLVLMMKPIMRIIENPIFTLKIPSNSTFKTEPSYLLVYGKILPIWKYFFQKEIDKL